MMMIMYDGFKGTNLVVFHEKGKEIQMGHHFLLPFLLTFDKSVKSFR